MGEDQIWPPRWEADEPTRVARPGAQPRPQPTPAPPPTYPAPPQGAPPPPTPPSPPRRPPRRGRLGAPAIVAIVLAIALAVIGTMIGLTLISGDKPRPVVTVYQSATDSPSPTPTPSASPTPTPTPTPSPSPSPSRSISESEATAALSQQHDVDVTTVTPQGQWTAVLSSKWIGVVDPQQTTKSGSHTFMAVDILDEHRAIRAAITGDARVVLLYGTDYGKQQTHNGSTMYLTLALGSWGSGDDVATWCAGRFPDRRGKDLDNVCMPLQLNPKG